MLDVQRSYGQHGAVLVNVDDLEAAAAAGIVADPRLQRRAVLAPLDGHGRVAFGNGARQRQPLPLLQVAGSSKLGGLCCYSSTLAVGLIFLRQVNLNVRASGRNPGS